MGKGDIKSGKGKRSAGSYGKTRLRKKDKVTAPVVAEKKAPAAKKTTKKEESDKAE